MKTWNVPEVAELEVALTADGRMGNNDEKHQYEITHNGNHPGNRPNEDIRNDDPIVDPS